MYEYRAIVTAVYDGDSITVDIDLGLGVWLHGQKIRLDRIDAPEMRGSTSFDAINVRDYVRSLILDKQIVLRTRKDTLGKFNRWVGDIDIAYGDTIINVNQLLLDKGYVKPYDGKSAR